MRKQGSQKINKGEVEKRNTKMKIKGSNQNNEKITLVIIDAFRYFDFHNCFFLFFLKCMVYHLFLQISALQIFQINFPPLAQATSELVWRILSIKFICCGVGWDIKPCHAQFACTQDVLKHFIANELLLQCGSQLISTTLVCIHTCSQVKKEKLKFIHFHRYCLWHKCDRTG